MTTPLPVHGADISHHQPSVNLTQAKQAGLDWIFHKATQGQGFLDRVYVSRRDTARQIGLPFGGYHFGETSNPENQVRFFLRIAGVRPIDMRPMLDVEDYAAGGSFFSRMSIGQRTDWVGRAVAVYKSELGVVPFLYNMFDLQDTFGCPLWVARYNNENELPRVPSPWKKWTIRQFTNGVFGVPRSFPGLGNVDLNCWEGDPVKQLQKYRLNAQKKGGRGTNVEGAIADLKVARRRAEPGTPRELLIIEALTTLREIPKFTS